MAPKGRDKFEQDCYAAATWVARLRSDRVTVEDQQAFALWLAEDPAHRQAMDEVQSTWDDLGVVRHFPPQAFPAREAANSPRWLAGAVAMAACLVLAVVLWPGVDDAGKNLYIQTALGEQQRVELEDDSVILLNTDSAVTVSYSNGLRRVELQRGEAWFKVSRDEQRPFEVDAGETRVTVLGTAFNVYRRGEGADITVTEGVVRVTELGDTGNRAAQAEVLHVNQQLLARPEGWRVAAVADTQRQLAWQRGELVATEMPLSELVGELQRYYPGRILIADPALAVQTVSGVFPLDEPEATLRALEVSLGIEVQAIDANTLQLLAAKR